MMNELPFIALIKLPHLICEMNVIHIFNWFDWTIRFSSWTVFTDTATYICALNRFQFGISHCSYYQFSASLWCFETHILLNSFGTNISKFDKSFLRWRFIPKMPLMPLCSTFKANQIRKCSQSRVNYANNSIQYQRVVA